MKFMNFKDQENISIQNIKKAKQVTPLKRDWDWPKTTVQYFQSLEGRKTISKQAKPKPMIPLQGQKEGKKRGDKDVQNVSK